MKHFLIDSELLPIKERADRGDIQAIRELFNAYASGEKAAHSYEHAKAYGQKIAAYYPQNIYCDKEPGRMACYSSFFYILGEIEKFDGNYKGAYKWYKKSIDHARAEKASEPFIARNNVHKLLREMKALIRDSRIDKIKAWLGDLYIKLFWKSYKRRVNKK